MGKKDAPEGTKWCKQHKRFLPIEEFNVPPKGYRVNICRACSKENMARWERTNPEYLLDMERIRRGDNGD